jgi:DNA-binding SARP family transcriptional activator
LAELYIRDGDLEKALEHVEKMLEEEPDIEQAFERRQQRVEGAPVRRQATPAGGHV